MKSRHAAALVLLGWALLTPPILHDAGRWHPDTKAPLSKWIIAKSFDSKAECDNELAAHRKEAANPQSLTIMADQLNYSAGERVWRADDLLSEMKSELCLADDDPRLKGN